MHIDESDKTRVLIHRDGKVDNEQILIISASGGGKSLFAETFIEEFHKKGHIVISITDVKDENELCYAMLEPVERYHLNKLEYEGKKPRAIPVEMYHPFTFNIPSTLLPKMNLFTVPLKNIGREEISLLTESGQSTDTTTLLLNTLESMSQTDSIYDMIHKVQKAVKANKKKHFGKEIVETNKDGFFVEASQKGSITNLSEVVSLFKPFLKDYMLSPSKFPLNLDVVKQIFERPESYHCLITNWIKDEKMKYFTILIFFLEIMRNIKKTKKPILFVIEEVAYLVPNKKAFETGYKAFLADSFRNKLITMRSKGRGCSSLMTSQVWFDVDEKIREKATKTWFGHLGGIADVGRVSKELKYKRDETEMLMKLDRNCFVLYGKEDLEEFRALFPSHRHAESNYNFIETYSRNFPMIKYTETINMVSNHLKEVEKYYKEKSKQEQGEKIKEAKEEYEEKSEKKKVEAELSNIKGKFKDHRKASRDEKIAQCLELKEKGLSLSKIATALNIGKTTVKYYLDLAEERKKLPQINEGHSGTNYESIS